MNKTPSDVVFDDLAERFSRKIYGSRKGDLRLTLLWDDLLKHIPSISSSNRLNVLDAGAGLGQMSIKFAQAGHCVTLCEPSKSMLGLARERINNCMPMQGMITVSQSSIQTLDANNFTTNYDVIVCHAVLEWLAKPLPTLLELLKQLKPGAYFSLAFYNRESIVFKNLLKGNIRRAMSNKAGEEGGLTPPNPQSAPDVLACLNEYGLCVIHVSGIRCLSDYLQSTTEISTEDLLMVERELGQKEPYKWLGRYIHVIAQRPN